MSTWIKVYNSMPSHPKFVLAGDRAGWLFVCGLCYSNEHLTDGFIARHVLPVVSPAVKSPEALAAKLVSAGLWHEVDGGWRIHGYEDHQRSAEQVRDGRARDAQRKAGVRAASVGSPRGQNSESASNVNGVRDVDVDVEGEIEEGANAPSSKREKIELPAGFPVEVRPHLIAVYRILRDLAQRHDAKAVSPLSLASIVMARPHKPLVRGAHDFAAWADGKAQKRKDVVSGYRNWLDKTDDLANFEPLDANGLPGVAPIGSGGQVVPIRPNSPSDLLRQIRTTEESA